ncbi:DUF924 family protein [uncultured Tateyamaria sp.]|uniref:DUF924 family protein n=1 Tax=uncultured Tateyamaria sp. TaxID=455651 RepID=UPI00260BAE41|nr:DUF924 family protein [uncultured Tateyamaria sp.]
MRDPDHHMQDVLDFWFPDNGHQDSPETHRAFWNERMQGGMDTAIIEHFADLTLAGATGQLDHWSETARGRLALLIVLDQFPRSLWRDTPAAYAQDIKATHLALEGIRNGHFDSLTPWEQTFFVIAIGHCEGPDHLDRMNMLDNVVEKIIAGMPAHLAPLGDGLRVQHGRVKDVVARFARHPHRNDILGRPSTPDEALYVRKGEFPHNTPATPDATQ